jgi:hypothetical protein
VKGLTNSTLAIRTHYRDMTLRLFDSQ